MAEVWLWSQKQDIGPSPRGYHAMTYDSHKQKTLLFGGVSFPNEYLNDTWEWNGDTWTQVADTGPSLRYWHNMAFDTKTNKTVLFAGVSYSVQKVFNDTWEWDGKFWTQRQDIGPQKALHSMAYDSDRNHVVMFGGADNIVALSDTWELSVEQTVNDLDATEVSEM